VRCRRELLVAILVYVTLDLSLPAMPGAFVFEPADSVDSIGGGRVAVRVTILPASSGGPVALSPGPISDLPPRRAVPTASRPLDQPRAPCLPRGTCDTPPSSEDPH
jgi:hypothetical protein